MMAAPSWVDVATDVILADSSMHSGMTVDGMYGNIMRSFEQSFFDHSLNMINKTDFEIFTSTTNNWERASDVGVIPVPLRMEIVGIDFREITIAAEVYVVSGSGTMRMYFLDALGRVPHSTDAYLDIDDYIEFSLTSTQAGMSGSVTPTRALLVEAVRGDYDHTLQASYPIAYMHTIIKTDAPRTVVMDSIRIRESST